MQSNNPYQQTLINTLKKYTQLDDDSILAMLRDVPVTTASKGEVLLRQGEAPEHSFT